MFAVIGAMAEFERSLIQERVKAGLRNARAKGKRLGRPAAALDLDMLSKLRGAGLGWRECAKRLGVGVATAVRAAQRIQPASVLNSSTAQTQIA